MIELRPKPLTKSGFAPFGDVVEMTGADRLEINQGFAERFNGFATIDVSDQGGTPSTCIIMAQPRPQPIVIKVMERHPLGSQLFYPLQTTPWIILVCDDPADVYSYHAFITNGRQGVNYAKATWHHPLLVTEKDSGFFEVSRLGEGKNLEEIWLETEISLRPTP